MKNSLTVLEKVAAIRQVLTVAKAVQEKAPDRSVADVMDAIETALYMKLGRLQGKPYAKLTPAQVVSLEALKHAKLVLQDVLDILGADDTRALTEDEIADMMDAQDEVKAKRKAAADKRKAAKAEEAEKAALVAAGQTTLALS